MRPSASHHDANAARVVPQLVEGVLEIEPVDRVRTLLGRRLGGGSCVGRM